MPVARSAVNSKAMRICGEQSTRWSRKSAPKDWFEHQHSFFDGKEERWKACRQLSDDGSQKAAIRQVRVSPKAATKLATGVQQEDNRFTTTYSLPDKTH